MEERYWRNLPALSEAEQALLSRRRVLIAGCGGLGGYLAEYLARLGVGEITAVDGDVFEETNLNRQLVCLPGALGQGKARALEAHIRALRPDVRFRAVEADLTGENAGELTAGQDLVLDALDSREARLLLEDACAMAGVALVHGAVRGWTAQAAVSLPGSGLLHRLYKADETAAGTEAEKTCLSFTPALCAAVEAAEAAKLLCGRASSLAGKALCMDLQAMEAHLFQLEAPRPSQP